MHHISICERCEKSDRRTIIQNVESRQGRNLHRVISWSSSIRQNSWWNYTTIPKARKRRCSRQRYRVEMTLNRRIRSDKVSTRTGQPNNPGPNTNDLLTLSLVIYPLIESHLVPPTLPSSRKPEFWNREEKNKRYD